jgi:hypothetical protein
LCAPLAEPPADTSRTPTNTLEPTPTRHVVSGHVIHAHYPLAGLPPCATTDGPLGTIVLRAGDVPEQLDHSNLTRPGLEVSPREVLLRPRDGSRPLGGIWVRDGREIIVAPQPGAEHALEPYILGSGLGAICLQNGLLPLHASAVVHGAAAIAFAGVSEAGKSTMAAALVAQGCLHVTDDLAVLSLGANGRPMVYPGLPTIKLNPDSSAVLGFDPARGELLSPTSDKLRFASASATLPARALTLAAVYLLERGDTEDVTIEPVTGAHAIAALAAEIYRSAWLAPMEILEARMRDVALMARHTPCFRLRRPHRFDLLPKVVDAVLKHREALAAGQARA